MTRPPSILKLSEDNESKELEFELEYLRSLSFEERMTMMREKSKKMLKQLVELGYRKPAISETLKSRNSTESSEYRVWALFTAFGILQEFVQGDSDLPQSGKSYQ